MLPYYIELFKTLESDSISCQNIFYGMLWKKLLLLYKRKELNYSKVPALLITKISNTIRLYEINRERKTLQRKNTNQFTLVCTEGHTRDNPGLCTRAIIHTFTSMHGWIPICATGAISTTKHSRRTDDNLRDVMYDSTDVIHRPMCAPCYLRKLAGGRIWLGSVFVFFSILYEFCEWAQFGASRIENTTRVGG